MNTNVHSLRNAAYHEAGHAVVAFLTGYYVVAGDADISRQHAAGKSASIELDRVQYKIEEKIQQGWNLDDMQIKRQHCFILAAGYTSEQALALRENRHFDEAKTFQAAHFDVCEIRNLWGKGVFNEFCKNLLPEIMSEPIWCMIETLAGNFIAHHQPMSVAAVMECLNEMKAKNEIHFRMFSPDFFPKPAV